MARKWKHHSLWLIASLDSFSHGIKEITRWQLGWNNHIPAILVGHPVDIIPQKSHHLVLSSFAPEDCRFFHKKETFVGAIINNHLAERLVVNFILNKVTPIEFLLVCTYVQHSHSLSKSQYSIVVDDGISILLWFHQSHFLAFQQTVHYSLKTILTFQIMFRRWYTGKLQRQSSLYFWKISCFAEIILENHKRCDVIIVIGH